MVSSPSDFGNTDFNVEIFHLTFRFIMRDLERLCGAWRLGVIYFGSGILGNAVSAIFVPHRAESGPSGTLLPTISKFLDYENDFDFKLLSGSHFGILAALFIEIVNAWPLLKSPLKQIGKLCGIIILLFLFGIFPWVDNFAHIFGFIGGLFLSLMVMPYIEFEHENGTDRLISNKTQRRILVGICMLIFGVMLLTALLVFYLAPEYNCQVRIPKKYL